MVVWITIRMTFANAPCKKCIDELVWKTFNISATGIGLFFPTKTENLKLSRCQLYCHWAVTLVLPMMTKLAPWRFPDLREPKYLRWSEKLQTETYRVNCQTMQSWLRTNTAKSLWWYQVWVNVGMETHSVVLWRLSWWRHQMETFFALLALCAGN